MDTTCIVVAHEGRARVLKMRRPFPAWPGARRSGTSTAGLRNRRG